MLRMSSDNSLSDMLEVHQPELRPAMPMEGPPAPTNTLTPMVFSKLSTTFLIPLMDSELPEPTFPLPLSSAPLSPLSLPFSTSPFQLPLLTLLRLLLPRLNLLLLTLPPLLPSPLSFHTHMLVPMVSVLVFSVVFTPLLPVPLLLTLLTL